MEAVSNENRRKQPYLFFLRYLPGLALSLFVASVAIFSSPIIASSFPLPPIVIALLIGMALNPIVAKPVMQSGFLFAGKQLLRWSVALLGFRVGLSDIAALGIAPIVIVIVSMIFTAIAGFLFARMAGQDSGLGAMIGIGTAVCGASATLATSTVVPPYQNKQSDIIFTIVGLNALATVAMVLYPPVCKLLGFDDEMTGILLGATIHDVAQVAGAGYSISVEAGNSSVVVKLFRVFLLLPCVVAVSIYLNKASTAGKSARVPIPLFAIAFVGFCFLNSAAQGLTPIAGLYLPAKSFLITLSNWGLLVAISALGLNTSCRTVLTVGWKHAAVLFGTTVVIFVTVATSLWAIK